MVGDPEYGTKQHMDQVWARIQLSPVLTNVGDGAKLARWLSWFQCYRCHLQEHWSTFALVIVVLGMHKQWWSGPDEALQMSRTCLAAEVAGECGEIGEPQEADEHAATSAAQTMKQSSEEVQALRNWLKNTLQFAGIVMVDRRNNRPFDVAHDIMRPLDESQAKSITQAKTRMGLHAFYVDSASEHHLVLVRDIMRRCAATVASLTMASGIERLAAGRAELRQLAKTAVVSALSLVAKVMPFRVLYSHSVPFSLARLLSPKKDVRADCLRWCQRLWAKLETIEAKAAGGDSASLGILRAMWWPQLVWPRELLLHLRAVRFEWVPAETVGLPLRRWVSGWGSSKLADDAINIAKGVKTNAQSQKHQVNHIMSNWAGSALLEDANRPPAPRNKCSAALKSQIVAKSAELSRGNAQTCSIDQESLAHFGSAAHQPMSAETWRLQGVVTAAVMSTDDDLTELGNSWMSLMFKRGVMVQRAGTPIIGWSWAPRAMGCSCGA